MMYDYDVIIAKNNSKCPNDYEELTVEEFFEREQATEKEQKEFFNKYFAVNIHQLVAKEKLSQIYELIEDVQKDPRLAKLNAVVFLSLKRKGRGETFHSVSKEEFEGIVNKCLELGIRFGFDSCSANKVIEAVKGTEKEYLKTYCEPCESSCMSAYINAYGEYFPCSFTEGTKGWEKGIDVISCKDFVEDVWFNPRTQNFRELLLMNCRYCPVYNV